MDKQISPHPEQEAMIELEKLTSEKRYPVLWAEVSALLKTRERRYVAIYGYSGRICKVESHRNILPVMIITDLYASPEHGRCEEERRCLDFDCPLNKTTWESLQAEGEISKRKKKPHGWKPTTIAYNRAPDGGLHDFSGFVSDRGGLIVREPKRRKQA
jgi:hypothetical protein